MDIKTKVNGKDITITLTKDQLAEIAKQTKNQPTIDDLNSIDDALRILGKSPDYYKDMEFEDKQDEANSKVKMIVKAANFIDNGYKPWKADFSDDDTRKYIPYAVRKSSGWVLYCVIVIYTYSYFSAALYYKEESTAQTLFNRFLKLYNDLLEG